MSTYIVFSMGEPKYKVEAYFYDVDKHFMSFYDEDDNLIGSFNTDLIDFVISDKFSNNVYKLDAYSDDDGDIDDSWEVKDLNECDDCGCDCDCENCKDKDCESKEEDSDYEYWEYRTKNKNKSFNADFDAIMKKIINGKE